MERHKKLIGKDTKCSTSSIKKKISMDSHQSSSELELSIRRSVIAGKSR